MMDLRERPTETHPNVRAAVFAALGLFVGLVVIGNFRHASSPVPVVPPPFVVDSRCEHVPFTPDRLVLVWSNGATTTRKGCS